MRAFLSNLKAKFSTLGVRERVFILLFAVVAPISIWDALVLAPLDKSQQVVQKKMESLQVKTLLQKTAAEHLEQTAYIDPDKATRKRLNEVSAQLRQSRHRLEELTEGLISPAQMATVLQDLLESETGLTLLRLENIPIKPFVEADSAANVRTNLNEPDSQSAYLYQHGLMMDFEGTFEDAQRYLQVLEDMPWQFYWDEIKFDVRKYPIARVRLKVHTLSLGEGWIGV